MRQARGFFLSLLEIEFGEALTPGPRIQRNAADLRARGREREAKVLEAYEPGRKPSRWTAGGPFLRRRLEASAATEIPRIAASSFGVISARGNLRTDLSQSVRVNIA